MASKYECEIRFFIKDIEQFRARIKELGGVVDFPYQFTDYYYKPRHEQWDPALKNIRIREWSYPEKKTVIHVAKNQIMEKGGMKFKKSLYKEGKLTLFSGSLDECKNVLEDLGFEPWFTVKKKECKLYKIEKYDLITIEEFIPEIGYTGEFEIEGDDLEAASMYLKKALEILQIKEYTFKPMAVIMAETKNLK